MNEDKANLTRSSLVKISNSQDLQDELESEKINPRPHSPQHVNISFDDYHIDLDSKALLIPDIFGVQKEQDSLVSPADPSNQSGSSKTREKFTRRQLSILLVYAFTEFLSAVVISLQSPFYPAEAEKKGVTASEYGAVFGVFEITIFFVSFIYGKYMTFVGPKFVYNLGLLATGVCSIFFGMLDRIEDRTAFFALSMITRIMEAIASGGCMNAAFVIIAIEFPNSVATSFATMETFYGVGFAVGPIIGGALFELGGFSLPFVSTGILLICISAFTFFVLPTPVDSGASNEEKRGILGLLKIPEVGVAAFAIFATALSIGHLSATMEPHIRIFDLSSIQVSLVIVIGGAIYAVLAPLWGMLCDRKPTLLLYMLIGSLFTILAFVLIGPAPFLPLDTTLWMTCLGQFCHGIGVGGTMVASFVQALISASVHGYPESVSTYSLISGMWGSCFSLGNFVGPTLSGILYDTVGFRNGTLVVIALHSLVVIALILIMSRSQNPEKNVLTNPSSNDEEKRPLLGNNNTR